MHGSRIIYSEPPLNKFHRRRYSDCILSTKICASASCIRTGFVKLRVRFVDQGRLHNSPRELRTSLCDSDL